ncbi:MAG: hypothetical protein LBB68_07210 [Treponema sp.]|jgi:hypothetical protein|nr:hypothetical protein [Treponema sp.]
MGKNYIPAKKHTRTGPVDLAGELEYDDRGLPAYGLKPNRYCFFSKTALKRPS